MLIQFYCSLKANVDVNSKGKIRGRGYCLAFVVIVVQKERKLRSVLMIIVQYYGACLTSSCNHFSRLPYWKRANFKAHQNKPL